jgi:hypothetical protein
MRDRVHEPARGPGVPRALQPYKQSWKATWAVIAIPILLLGLSVLVWTAGTITWLLVFPWVAMAGSAYCYVRGRASNTVIPGTLWDAGQGLLAIGALLLLLVAH